MQSGKSKRRNNDTYLELTVTDPCTESFPDCPNGNEDGAIVYIPKGTDDAYIRLLAKHNNDPLNDPYLTIDPALNIVEDENGNYLYFVGTVIEDGWETTDRFYRHRGKSKAINITGLFEFTGKVCYFEMAPTSYDYTEWLCCDIVDTNGDTVPDAYENCEINGIDSCDGGKTEVLTYCVDYTDEWVFNIDEFVEYFWDVDNNGVKLAQVRFYPK